MSADLMGTTARNQLRSAIERIERLELEKSEVGEQIKEVFAEAKGSGFDVKILRKVVRIRKQDRAKRLEEEAITDLYLSALEELPLFEAREDGPEVTVTFSRPDGSSVTAPLSVVGQAIDHLSDDEALYREAREVVTRDRKASTSYVQRRLGVGYNKAAAQIERLEREGVIGPANYVGKREVLALATAQAA